MSRDFLTNRWVLGGVGFLIVFAVACYLWYQHDIAPYKQEAAEAAKIARQWDIEKAETDNTAETVSPQVPAESTPPTADSPIIETPVTKEIEPTQAQTEALAQTAETQDVPVSPFGFGPYPEVPQGFPSNIRVIWQWPNIKYSDEAKMNFELAARVLIKLWNEGDTAFTGCRIASDQKVYPHYPDVIYVKYVEKQLEDGSISKTIGGLSRGADLPEITPEMLESGEIPGFRLIDEKEGGIDPYDFLNL